MIYAIDFDGTLCKNLYPKIGDPIKATIDFCKRHKENGDQLILWTCRSDQTLDDAVEWCKEQGIEFDAINENIETSIKKFKSDSRKVHADFYIDDKNIQLSELEERGDAMPLKDNREYRNLSILQPQDQQKRIDSECYVEGYATTFDKPYLLWEYDGVKYYEVIDRHALDNADMSDIIMQYDHNGKVLARNSNRSLIVEPNDNGLFICADLSKSKASQEMYEEINNGLVTRMSWAFTVEEDSYNSETRTRTILKVKKIYDVSAVSIPANQDTEISARSYLNGVIEAERQELLEREKHKQKIRILMEVNR